MTDYTELAGLSLGEALPFFEKSPFPGTRETVIEIARNAVGGCPLAGGLNKESPCVAGGAAACDRGLVPRIVRVREKEGRLVITAACFVPPAREDAGNGNGEQQ